MPCNQNAKKALSVIHLLEQTIQSTDDVLTYLWMDKHITEHGPGFRLQLIITVGHKFKDIFNFFSTRFIHILGICHDVLTAATVCFKWLFW